MTEQTERAEVDPILVSVMRRNPRGEVRYMPNTPERAAMTGTSAAGFLREYDEALAAAEARGAERALREAAAEVRALAARGWGGDRSWLTTGTHVGELVAGFLEEIVEDRAAARGVEGGAR
jgi:hypothetical protein